MPDSAQHMVNIQETLIPHSCLQLKIIFRSPLSFLHQQADSWCVYPAIVGLIFHSLIISVVFC